MQATIKPVVGTNQLGRMCELKHSLVCILWYVKVRKKIKCKIIAISQITVPTTVFNLPIKLARIIIVKVSVGATDPTVGSFSSLNNMLGWLINLNIIGSINPRATIKAIIKSIGEIISFSITSDQTHKTVLKPRAKPAVAVGY